MKKTSIAVVTYTMMSAYLGFAGSMGPMNTEKPSSFYYYTGAEASATWIDISATTYNSITAESSSHIWGGRFLAGLANHYRENITLMGEIGGGYYGTFDQEAPILGATLRTVIDGYDFLVGGAYKINSFDVFGQVGLMVQNARSKVNQDFAKQTPGGAYSGIKTSIFNQTQALPEIKVGGKYNFNENWGVSVAYMRVFGTHIYNTSSETITSDAIAENGIVSAQNPTLNAVLFGVRYNFV